MYPSFIIGHSFSWTSRQTAGHGPVTDGDALTYPIYTINMSVLTTEPTVWSRRNLIRTFDLLVLVFCAEAGTGLPLAVEDLGGDSRMVVGNRSSMKPCQTIFGGLLMMLKTTNLMIWEMSSENGVLYL